MNSAVRINNNRAAGVDRSRLEEEDEHEFDSDSSFNFKRLLPSPLRECLSGYEQNKSGNMMVTPPPASSFLPSLRSSSRSSVPSCGSIAGKVSKRRSKTGSVLDGDPLIDARSTDIDSAACSEEYPNVVGSLATDSSVASDVLESEYDFETSDKAYSFLTFRLSYLFVTLVVMLADGLQGADLRCVHFTLLFDYRSSLLTLSYVVVAIN